MSIEHALVDCDRCHEPLIDGWTCLWSADGRVEHASCTLAHRRHFYDSPTMQAAVQESFGDQQ